MTRERTIAAAEVLAASDPVMAGLVAAHGPCRFGTKPLIVTGLAVLAAGLGLLATADPGGSFVVDVLPGSLISAVGMALVFIPATMAAIGGVAPDQGGLASGIVNTTYQIGSALGLAVMTAIATARGADQIGDPEALVDGFQAAFLGAGAIALIGAGLAAAWLRSPRASAAAAPTTEGSFAD